MRRERGGNSIHDREHYYLASGWQLMWRKFRRHRLAIGGGTVLALLFTMSIFAEFFTPYSVGAKIRQLSPSIAHPAHRRFGTVSRSAIRIRDYFAARSRDVCQGVRGGPRRPLPHPLVRGGRALPPVGVDPGTTASVRRRRARRRVPVRHRRHRPGRLLAHPVRGSRVAADRPGRRVSDLRHRRYAGRHIGLLRRPCRHADPAGDRVSHVDTHDSAVARPQRGDAQGLDDTADLLRHRGDSVSGGVGPAGARRARQAAGAARPRLRHGGPPGRHAGVRHHLAATCCRTLPAT